MVDTKEYLTESEHNAYVADLTKVVTSTIDGVIKLADKHNVDRDSAMEHFAKVLSTMSQISTFRNWEGSGSK